MGLFKRSGGGTATQRLEATMRRLTGDASPELLAEGLHGRARCIGVVDTGSTVSFGGVEDPIVGFQLEVEVDGRPPYQVSHRQRVPRLMVAQVQPTATFAVRVNPADPHDLAIDWSG